MKSAPQIHLSDVQTVYSGPEGRLWELLMGEQIHIGGFQSSMDLAQRAGIAAVSHGVDLCCCTGAGMRFLARFLKVARMTGVDATPAMLQLGRQRCADEGLAERMSFVEANVCATGLPSGGFDFVWGEDAWCYVEDKAKLIAEAARLVKAQGKIAFTDWMEGPAGLTDAEAARFLGFMKFPNLLALGEYRSLLEDEGCSVRSAHDTGRFAAWMPLYLDMIEKQLTFDALKIIGFDLAFAQSLIGEMRFIQSLAQDGKIMQGLVVAEKTR
jgi:ubiquinone/menaquinone biosynthesis C-methylase UbiE